MPTTAVMTARALLALVEPFGPSADGAELVFDADPPGEWVPALMVLHTGLRAVLTGRRWWGSATDRPRVVELNPAAPIPAGIALLAVEGDVRWDRIHPAARIDLPYLFATGPVAGPSGSGRRHTVPGTVGVIDIVAL